MSQIGIEHKYEQIKKENIRTMEFKKTATKFSLIKTLNAMPEIQAAYLENKF